MRNISTYHKALFSLLFLIGILVLVAFFANYLNRKKTEVFVESNVRQLENSVTQVLALNDVGVKQGVADYTYWDEMVKAIEKPSIAWTKENIDPMIITFHLESAWAFDTLGKCVMSSAIPTYKWLKNVVIPKSVIDSLLKNRFFTTTIKTQGGYLELIGATVHYTSDPKRLLRPHGFYIVGRFLGKPFLNNLSKILAARVVLTTEPLPAGLIRSDETIAVMIPFTVVEEHAPLYLYVEKKIPFLRQFTIFSQEMIWLLLGASLIILVGVWFTFSKWVTQPLNLVRRLLATNDLTAVEKLKRYGNEFQEIGELIKQSVEHKQQLEFLKQKAEESDQLKSSFLANMSHEIRTPLNGILGFSELLCEQTTEKEYSKNCVSIIKGCSDDLLQIINDLFDISKLEANQMTIHPEIINGLELLAELEQQYKFSSLNKNGLELVINATGPSINIRTDRIRLKQVLINLLNNGLKFTQAGTVEAGCYVERAGFAVFFVKDTGIGIPETHQELIFERFRQFDSNFTVSRDYGGVGLGLSICKGLVDKMGGNISVNSVLGEGSTFFVRIPLASRE